MTFSRSGYDTQIKLSPEELFEISQEISRKFAPRASNISSDMAYLHNIIDNRYSYQKSSKNHVNSIFHSSHYSQTQLSPQEIFEISENIRNKFAPNISSSVPELVLLPVDPHHLYAYWNLGENNKITQSEDVASNPLIMRIYWRPDENTDIKSTRIWFDLALHSFQSRQKVRLPIDGTSYSAAIGTLYPDNNLKIHADSNVIHVPCDKMKTPAFQRKEKPSASTGAPALSAVLSQEKSRNTAEAIRYEQQGIPNTATDGIRYPKDFDKLLGADKTKENEIIFFSKLKNMMYECEKNINEQLIFKASDFEPFHYKNKNASGQGR